MSHEERPNFLKILEDLRSCSVDTSSTGKSDLSSQTEEQLIETIRQNAAELYRRGVVTNTTKFNDYQLPVIKSLEDWHSGKTKPLPDAFLFDSFNIMQSVKTDKEKSVFAFRNLFPEIDGHFKDTVKSFHSQYTIEELQKILLKHPNRMDLKMELMKLQRENKTKYIGRPKRKKRK